jgi:hypothetical protein
MFKEMKNIFKRSGRKNIRWTDNEFLELKLFINIVALR